MLSLIRTFTGLCLLRTAPQDVPYSRALLFIALGAYVMMSYILALLSTGPTTAMVLAVIDGGMLVGLAIGGLWVLSLPSRNTQLITALAGSGAIWQLAAFPVAGLLSAQPAATEPTVVTQVGGLLYLALVVWAIAIIGHILRHAFNMKFFFAAGIAVLYVYTSMRVGSALIVAAQ